MQTIVLSGVALACVVAFDIARRCFQTTNRSSYPLPPGPPGLPFVGNFVGVDSEAPWRTYAEWAKKYGDLIYTRVLGKDIIIINSEAVAKDLLESRSKNYSDRPFMITKDLCGRGFSSIFLEYGDRWRMHRRFFHQTFRSESVHRFRPLQERKVRQLLRRLLDSPEQYADHIFEYTASIVLNSVYDYDPKSQKEDLFEIISNTLKITHHALRPDISLVIGAFPAILHLPSWLPGMSFKRDMALAKAYSKQYIEMPFEYSLQRLSAGSSEPTMVFDALRKVEDGDFTIASAGMLKDLSEAAGTAFMAASDTSNSIILSFLLLMVVNPEVQKKAQAQMDAVVGGNRVPTIEDRPLLPYVDAIIRETLRYHPIVPLAIPHAVVEDDIYDGYLIPKGAIIITNLWSMGHNELKYPNPHDFIPERFLEEDGSLNSDDVEHIAFGFGRRICVGRYFADTSVWSVIAKILATFSIGKAKDEHGVEIPVQVKYTSGVTTPPYPFRCSIQPRISGMDAEKLERLMETTAD